MIICYFSRHFKLITIICIVIYVMVMITKMLMIIMTIVILFNSVQFVIY